jgi:hypothetical protein
MIDLRELNQGMLISGRLSEVHIYNLKQYPFLVFNNIESIEISYNLEPLFDNQDGAYVEYTLKFKSGLRKTDAKKIEENSKILRNMVQVLLSKKVRVDILSQQKEKDYVAKKPRSVRKRRSSSRSE